ncbi:MAG TPA: hypothetical protein H9830_03585, partial [Candidatus Agrococcus pullicola]|nr:hypothetical protein [Candidatus Agrococcus pullicola]
MVTRDRRRRQQYFSAVERERAYSLGFTPGIVANFGISESNLHQFISLRDYLYAQPFNGKYNKWVRDRVSALLVFEPFETLFDTVHYQLVHHDGVIRVSPISAAARAAGIAIDNVLGFIADRGSIIVTSSRWSVTGTVTVNYEDGNYLFDDVVYSAEEAAAELLELARRRSLVLLEPHPDSHRSEGSLRIDVTMMNPQG